MKSETVWIWGRHPVLEALHSRRARSILVASGRKPASVLNEILTQASRQGVQVREVPYTEVEALAPGANTQGVAALVDIPLLKSVDDLLTPILGGDAPAFILVLDEIQDPHNLGALLRSAEAAGVHGVVVPDRRSAPLTGTVAKTSAGALSHLPILEVTNLARALDDLKRAGIWVLGLEAFAELSIYDAQLTMPLALAIGGEGTGLRRLTRERCDVLLKLPLRGKVSSLNASVAGSIAMFEAVRQREVGS